MPSLTPFAFSPVVKEDIDRNTALCLACFSSLPPKKLKTKSDSQASAATASSDNIFTTPCCQRPICFTCISTNPRLLRYDPCLACLGGVGVVSSSPPSVLVPRSRDRPKMNVDGAMRDDDTFVLGGEDDSDSESDNDHAATPAPPYQELDTPNSINVQGTVQEDTLLALADTSTSNSEKGGSAQADVDTSSSPLKYYIARSDNLQGLCLRYGLDGHELCKLNSLPPSTLTTTPHILHTRRFLILPPSARKTKIPVNNETPEQQKAREAKWGKERAEKRLQTLTKEVDWRVAKAYVALADDAAEEIEERDEWQRKKKEMTDTNLYAGPSNLEERAIRRYLDDNEWEEGQLREGSRIGSLSNCGKEKGGPRQWWKWGS